jgi:hypothetical protein
MHHPTLPIRALLLALALGFALCAGTSHAEIVTIAFESGVGDYDPDHPMNGVHGPYDWEENGARYGGWWLNDVGTPTASSQVGHTHIVGENDSVYPLVGDLQHSWRDSLQGTTISFDPGYAFDVISVDVRIMSRDTPAYDPYNMQRLPWTFALTDTRLLLTDTAVDPVAPDFATFASQFVAVPIDDGTYWDNGDGTFDPNLPSSEAFQTITITGFDDITTLHLSHSAGLVWIDNIVLDVDTSTPVPEPGLVSMLAVGALLLGAAARRPSV